MIERITLVLTLIAASVAAFYVLRSLHLRRMQPLAGGAGLPTLLYFRSNSCAACPAQGRAIDQLAAQWDGRLRVERIDAEREPETAARYNIFTLPTTVLVDDGGRVRQVNYGLTDARKLGQQLAALREQPPTAGGRPPREGNPSAVALDNLPLRPSVVEGEHTGTRTNYEHP